MYYLTDKGHPVKSNCPAKTWTACNQQTYDIKCKEINDKCKADDLALEESLKPQREYEAKIQIKLREMAIKEIEKEG